jgi:molybdopterin converting factor small subunit
MKIKLIAYGIAKDILKSRSLEIESTHGATIASLKVQLYNQYPELSHLASLSLAVGENYQSDDYVLHENDEVVILPPVSGG